MEDQGLQKLAIRYMESTESHDEFFLALTGTLSKKNDSDAAEYYRDFNNLPTKMTEITQLVHLTVFRLPLILKNKQYVNDAKLIEDIWREEYESIRNTTSTIEERRAAVRQCIYKIAKLDLTESALNKSKVDLTTQCIRLFPVHETFERIAIANDAEEALVAKTIYEWYQTKNPTGQQLVYLTAKDLICNQGFLLADLIV